MLDNAVKYTSPGGTILVAAMVVGDTEKDMVDLIVSASGIPAFAVTR